MRFLFALDRPVTCKMHQKRIEHEALPDIRRLIEKKEALSDATEGKLTADSVRRGNSIKPNVFRPRVKAVDLGFGESFFFFLHRVRH